MFGTNKLRAIVRGRLSAKKPETAVGQESVEAPGVRRMYAFANTLDPRLSKLLKLVEQAALTSSARAVSFTRGQADPERLGFRLAWRSV